MVFIIVVTLTFYDKPDEITVFPVPSFVVSQQQCDEMIPELRAGIEPVRVRKGAKSLEIKCTGSVATKEK